MQMMPTQTKIAIIGSALLGQKASKHYSRRQKQAPFLLLAPTRKGLGLNMG